METKRLNAAIARRDQRRRQAQAAKEKASKETEAKAQLASKEAKDFAVKQVRAESVYPHPFVPPSPPCPQV